MLLLEAWELFYNISGMMSLKFINNFTQSTCASYPTYQTHSPEIPKMGNKKDSCLD